MKIERDETMRLILSILVMVLVAGMACQDVQTPDDGPDASSDQFNAIVQRIEALETAAAIPEPEPMETPALAPSPTPFPVRRATVPPTPAPTAIPSPTPIPVGRGDICYRSLPVQEALIDKFSNTYLCAAVQVAELFRITELDIEADGYLLKRNDFADMPNLKRLDLDIALGSLTPDLFHDLSGLERLYLGISVFDTGLSALPADLLSGLPPSLIALNLGIGMSSDWNENQALELPADMFASVPRLKHLGISFGSQGGGVHLKLDPQTLSGLNLLESLGLGGSFAAIPREAFADLESLEELDLYYSVSRDPHILYFPTSEMVLKFREFCRRNSDICVVGGTIE